ncbi:hypothetical protein GTO89_14995 [Heliobacterium gestii]|uniref:Uncharacterized protein n=1 Tax=Heliomicrobium gestii TaxID=2699 RepID=A0A845LH63_HELGE|nr:hypothetical protein [Heliomicrobium gestii]MBM7868134.1 rubrerythrin [Heliomicrobium gestii]MZP44340.1 hypothetical protein [Heliomicrobium gestii]
MELNTRDFLMKSLLNEQELVRDYQQFAQTTDDREVGKLFQEYAETDALRANRIKDILQNKYGLDADEK